MQVVGVGSLGERLIVDLGDCVADVWAGPESVSARTVARIRWLPDITVKVASEIAGELPPSVASRPWMSDSAWPAGDWDWRCRAIYGSARGLAACAPAENASGSAMTRPARRT